MKLEFSARALQEIESAARWWREHRPDAPGMLREELERHFDLLKSTPRIGELWGERRGVEIRRLVLPKTQKKLYFAVVGVDVIRVYCLWGGERGREPQLR